MIADGVLAAVPAAYRPVYCGKLADHQKDVS
jgi:hypothetical protein